MIEDVGNPTRLAPPHDKARAGANRPSWRSCWQSSAILVVFMFTNASQAADAPEETLRQAVEAYQTAMDTTDRAARLNQFHQAELLFQQLTAAEADPPSAPTRWQSADLYVNLGNAALGGEHLGTAILAYRRALTLDPDHSRARQNLQHARSILPDWVPTPEPSGGFDSLLTFLQRLTFSELQSIAAGMFVLAALLLAAAFRFQQKILGKLAVLPGCVWLFFMAASMIRLANQDVRAAVIIVPEVTARAADSHGAPPKLSQPLPSGTEVEVLEQRDEWSRVQLVDRREAWLPTTSLAHVLRPRSADVQ